MERTVALATCRELPDLDPDGAGVVAAFNRFGVTAVPLIWDDPAAPFADFDLTVIRTCWDYVPRREAFLAWASTLPRVLNPVEMLRWSTDKRYLAELAAAGFPIPASWFFAPGEEVSVPEGRCVVKPTVGAGSRGARRFEAEESSLAIDHARALQREGATALIQPYLDGVDAEGESALLFFNGEFSHSITKGPMLEIGGVGRALDATGLAFAEQITPHKATDEERDLARRLIDWLPEMPTYARVDLLPSADGPVIVELELVEPSLFFQMTSGAEERFASAVVDRLN